MFEIRDHCKDCIFPGFLNCTISHEKECHCHNKGDNHEKDR